MSSRGVASVAVLSLAVALPATASATTFTVDPSAAAGCDATTHVCKTIGAANQAVADNDTVEIKPGDQPYAEAPIVVVKQNVTFTAAPGASGKVVIASGADGQNVFELGDSATAGSGDGTTLRGLVIEGIGGRAVLVRAARTTVDGSVLRRQAPSSNDFPVYEVVDVIGATNTVTSSIVLQNQPTPLSAPAMSGGGASTLVLSDDLVLSGPANGSGVVLTGNATNAGAAVPNVIERCVIFATRFNAVEISSAATSASAKALTVDSSILSGGTASGASGAGLRASSAAVAPPGGNSAAGDVKVTVIHTTIAGSPQGIVIDAAANGPLLPSSPQGSIEVDVDRSIVHGQSTVANNTMLLSAPNTAKLVITRSDTPTTASATGGATITTTDTTNNSDAALFVDPAARNFHLRADAPVIDKAGPVGAGESDRDVDRDPRVVGAGSDLGADEFVNKPPVAAFRVDHASARQNEKVTFDGSGSRDPEAGAGGSIAEYRWNFGDGTTMTTTSANVPHPYSKVGAYKATLVVVDNFGAASAPAGPVTITVTDGTPPTVAISRPKRNQTIRLVVGGVHTVIRFAGTAKDEGGIGGVELSLRRLSSHGRPVRVGATTCVYFDGKRRFVSRSCRKPVFFHVRVSNGRWAYRIKRGVKVRRGLYELSARATDKAGNVSTRVRVRFRLS